MLDKTSKVNDKATKEKKVKDPINIFVMLKKIYPLMFQDSPIYTMAWIIIGIAHGISWGMGVTVTQMFFDSINEAINGNTKLVYVILMLIAFGGIGIVQYVLNGVHNFITNMMWQKKSGYFNYKINEKSSKIAPIEYENPKRHDDINKAGEGASSAILFVFGTSTIFTFYLPYFMFMAGYLFTLNPILIFSILLVFVPVLIAQLIRSPIYAKLEDKAAPIRREFEFYEQAIVDKTYFKETRLLGTFNYFKKRFFDTMHLLNKAIWKAHIKSSTIALCLDLISLIGQFGIMYLLFHLLLKGEITIGAFAAVYASIGKLFDLMNEIITKHIGTITKNFGLIRNFLRFLDIPVREGIDAVIDTSKGIDISNVTFKYPQAETNSLENLSLRINAGETVAIVGENGAGKTTLVKLLIGLYTPTNGSVKIGGCETCEVSAKSVYRSISGVFQRYQRYQFTLDENVKISDIDIIDERDIIGVLEQSGVDAGNANTFPQGIGTMLSRDFDGVDLSGGEWQRVAIARGFYRMSDIIVLDEPTAAIDPIEESRIYKKFAEIAANKTAVIVTHRMASAKIANRIVVMDKGRIAEIGSHDELIAKGGLYADMYNAQSEWYESSA